PGSSPGTTGVRSGSGGRLALGQHAHDVRLLHDQELFIVDLDLSARPLAEQYAVADLEVDRDQLAGLIATAGADGDDFALGRLFLGGVRNDDATLGLFLGVDTFDHDTVMQRTKFGLSHDVSLWKFASEVAEVVGPRPRPTSVRIERRA